MKFFCFLFSIIFLLALSAKAQDESDPTKVLITEQDSLLLEDIDQVKEIIIDTLENRPNTAALYSAALPGLGQAYNKKYWKIPIIYGGTLVVGYFISYNSKLYKQYYDGLIAIIDEDPRTVPFDPSLQENTYQRAVDYYRRNRDLLVIGGLLLYVLNIVDAHVDAHLQLFTVDEDISLNLEPSFEQTIMHTNLIGLSLKLRFN